MARLRDLSAPAALVLLNAWIVGRLFHTEYTVEMGSIEAAYISLARYILGHFPQSTFFTATWFPLWYGGIPYPDSYPPLMHALDAAVAYFCRISPALAYHAVCAAVYVLTPVALYWLARRLGAGIAGAFTGGLLYSLISPSCFLIADIRADQGWFGPRRIENLAHFGDGPLQLSFLFLLVALGLLHLALERRRPVYFLASGLAIACVALTNWIGAVALALMLAAYLLSGLGGRGLSCWWMTAAAAIFAYALAMPWITPSVVSTIRANASRIVEYQFSNEARWVVVLAAVCISILAWLLARAQLHPRLRFAMLFAVVGSLVPLMFHWWHIEPLPQSTRYHVELDLALCLAAALAIPAKMHERHARILIACLIVFAVPTAIHVRRVGRNWTKPLDIHSTVQYEISTWLEKNMPGRRVFAPGTIGFWMDAFSDTPVLTGGFDNGIRNLFVPAVVYQVYAGKDRDLALAWLKAFGADAVIATEKGSREYFENYRFRDKFQGLPELWRDGGDVIYEVRRGTMSLAHVMRESDFVQRPPLGYEATRIEPYLRALEDPSYPPADFRWTKPGAAVITADLGLEHLISVQVTWDEGWRARVHNEPRPIWADKLSQIAIAPHCSGPCTIDLTYDGTAYDHAADVVSPLALAAGALWVIAESLRRRIREAARRLR